MPLRERVNALSWFHRIDLGAGVITPGPDDTPLKSPAPTYLPIFAVKP
ncbi:MAG TPA: hypothetical protein VHZ55_04095 [Bryobacteraceae bacterium]|jgi:hypothetical protein|nr:hypothetical protein [Bryobacteraceae bacterium]